MATRRTKNDWATVDDWAAHRPLITALYADQNKTLRETKEIMETTHKFFATVRMYKARFQQWGIEKKIKAEDAVEIFRQQTARAKAGKSSVAYVRGRRISPDRLKRYRYRAAPVISEQILLAEWDSRSSSSSPDSSVQISQIIVRTPSPSPSPPDYPSISPRLEDPPELKVPQECMQILGSYIAGSFAAGAWHQDDPDSGIAETNDAFTWAHYLASSQGLIAHNRTKEGFFLLGICFDQYRSHLQRPDSFFWLAIYKAAMLLGYRDRKLADAFITYASKLTSLLLPKTHPFNLVWTRIMITGMPGLQQHAAALFQSYLDTWTRHVTSMDADPSSIVQMAFVFIQLHCSGMISYAFLRQITEMMMSLMPVSGQASQYLLQEAKFRMACVFLEKGKLDKAETMTQELIAWLDAQSSNEYIHLRIKCAWTMFEIKQGRGEDTEALQAGYVVVRLCQETYGMIHLQTLDAMSAVEQLHTRLNKTPGARHITEDFESRWAIFVDQSRERKGFPHLIEKPWYHRCIEMGEEEGYVQECIDLFERSSWLKET